MPARKRSRRVTFENEKRVDIGKGSLIQLVFGLTHDQVKDQS
jgi:hypothetical protein